MKEQLLSENIGDCPVGLKDTQGRMYRLKQKTLKMRISSSTLLDILDYPGSKKSNFQFRIYSKLEI